MIPAADGVRGVGLAPAVRLVFDLALLRGAGLIQFCTPASIQVGQAQMIYVRWAQAHLDLLRRPRRRGGVLGSPISCRLWQAVIAPG
jgi:hypothetical protein